MASFSRDKAAQDLERLSFGPENLKLGRYWLSLWDGDALPLRARFNPRKVPSFLPGIAIFEVQPDVSVHCRLFGSALVAALGNDITGQDLLAMTDESERATRLQRYTDVAHGAIGRSIRRGIDRLGEIVLTEEIMLPFGDVTDEGKRQVLFHANWRPTGIVQGMAELEGVGHVAMKFDAVRLRAA